VRGVIRRIMDGRWRGKLDALARLVLRGDGLRADLDLRTLSASRPSRSGRARSLGRVQRHRLRQLRAGGRTDRYGDFIDICAAITGRVPDAGLHRTENRRGRVLFDLDSVPERLLREDVLYPVLGHLIGLEAGNEVPVLDGLPESATEDQLKALGAAAASSGSVALFHVVGLTPEAPSPSEAF